ncbi:MAG: PAS domain S-box protein [Deltaproteobacteria bacterium]|nr:PAS domain S-box protein [Deltaproteobacteria bacterium]
MKKQSTRKARKRPDRAPERPRPKRKPAAAASSSAPAPDLFRLVFDNINDAVFVRDIGPDGKPGRFVEVNDVACRRLGYSRDKLLAMSPAGIDDPAAPIDERDLVEQNGSVASAVFNRVHVAKDGRKIPVEIGVRMVETAGKKLALSVARDVTERRNAERALQGAIEDLRENQAKTLALVAGLRESEERFRAVTATTLDAIILSDADGKMSLWNRGAETIFGYTEAETRGQPVEILLPERLVAEHRKGWERLRSGQSTKAAGKILECTGRRKDGTEFPIELSHFRWTSAGQPFFGTIIRDITERKAAEDEIRRHRDFLGQMVDERTAALSVAREHLAQTQKLDSIGQLAGGVAHDFNNLLSVILSYTGFVFDELPPDSKLRSDLEEVRKAADRATALTRQLLAFSRKQAITPREVSVKDSVGSLAKMLKRLIGEHVPLDLRIAEDAGVLFIDPSQLEQVIINLAVNARDAMHGGGSLVIGAKNVTLGAEQVADTPEVEAGAYVMLSVSDTGTGIPKEVFPKIFEPFFSTKEKGKGTGLGLSMVYGIVKQNKGHIEVESVVGTGTVFRVFFKRVQREGARQVFAAQGELPRGRGETILLVEDEDVVRASIARMLKGAGYSVIEAAGGAAALDRFRQNRGAIAAVLTDVIMPGMGGSALASELRNIDPAAKILFCSGYPDEMTGAQGALPTGTVLVGKPVDKADLLTKIREVLDAG